MSEELTHLSLTDVAEAIRTKQVSAVEVTAACLRRIERLQPKLNCFISIEAEAALKAAAVADADLARGVLRGSLHGVPLAHKDMFYRAGQVSTCGSKINRDFVPDHTATVLSRLEAAGAIYLGGLNMAEFALGPTGHNEHWGHCRNPWNPDYITGGSSSGSGSAVAARLTYGALGSDTGGSVRMPAGVCGVVGLKPTWGRVSRYGVMPLSFSLDTVGPLARTVQDCACLTRIIAGSDPMDSTSSTALVPDYEATLSEGMKGIKIGVPTNYYYDELMRVPTIGMSGLCHGSIFFSSLIVSIGVPLAILFTTKEPIVKENAKESLNFHINLYIYALIFVVLTLVLIGIPLLVLLGIISFSMPIIALLKVLNDPSQPYRYPFIFRLI